MNYIVYISTSITLLTDAELKSILMKSQENNSRDNLTGMLLYSEGTFVQVLEGDDNVLTETYGRILGDNRHKGIIKLGQGKMEMRNFPNWSMGFRTVSKEEFKQLDSFIDPAKSALLKNDMHPVLTILKTFAESNF